MKIEYKSDYVLVSSDENSFEDFVINFKTKHSEIKENHLFISISKNLNIVEKDIFVFLDYAEQHQQNGTTFVLVCPRVDVDEFPDEFNIVPTLHEAEDVLEMENIQRDLGF